MGLCVVAPPLLHSSLLLEVAQLWWNFMLYRDLSSSKIWNLPCISSPFCTGIDLKELVSQAYLYLLSFTLLTPLHCSPLTYAHWPGSGYAL
ncbi:hypothetical protein O6H91_01G171500 [Diphasiastrum complanatum]|uniref:Uncharacterized protein n=2 Tax=Diphasiastrum complanatum TaxID=34168 RepID=A0ACC2EYV5_DIPCM|nr:hypothetical protein O6H91_01G171500 [Diphasiastrum complanatum]KAJ7571670.1 hypothetical protein O6H91_01G171500 [Diphasiastrum complanatum]